MSELSSGLPTAGRLAGEAQVALQEEEARKRRLLLDPRPHTQTSAAVIDPMMRTGRWWWILFVVTGGAVMMGGVTWVYQMIWGLGITGLNRPSMWGLYIVNFVYFIGIGHAGTFISAALRVLKIEWRRPISRAAETLTVFALGAAALFPLIHLGRSWKFYYLIPFFNQRQLWPSFHSPLLWDMTAIFAYLTCSILFAYMGLLPDLANVRDHTTGWRQRFYRALALGWRGTEKEWHNQEVALNVFSYAIIPVMFSVHTIVSWDFATALQPQWHSSIFGPYFVMGALFSGTGAVIIVLAIVRKTLHLEYFLRDEHFNGMGKFLLILSLTWTYFYFNDYLIPWYGGEPVDKVIYQLLKDGWAAPFWYLMLFSNIVVPCATLWSKKVRTSIPALFVVSLFVQIGMYLERYIIVPISLTRSWLPYSWGTYAPRVPDTYITIAAFILVPFLFLIFTRFFPVVPVWEVFEGQVLHRLRRIGKAMVETKAEPD